jgi:NAD(P)-dependent dehydrogenase (short-subunit alcohol dehydrogenase family)
MNLNLQKKHVLISGGSYGIGFACAEAFIQEEAKVCIIARNHVALNAAKERLINTYDCADSISIISADLTLSEKASEALKIAKSHFGNVDILVNCAGHAKYTPAQDLSVEDFHAAMNSKYFSYLNLMTPVIKEMGNQGSGSIINIAGRGGKVALPQHLPGGAANSALMLVSAGLAAAYANKGVRVNVINPGITETERFRNRVTLEAKQKNISEQACIDLLSAKIPMNRFAQPDEIAQAVLFLASSKASYLTGNILAMDGGILPII